MSFLGEIVKALAGNFGDAVPVLIVVMGLVQFTKKLGVEGRAATVVSMAIGAVIGICFAVAKAGAPADFAGGFGYALFGLFVGLGASGVYDLGNQWFGPISDPGVHLEVTQTTDTAGKPMYIGHDVDADRYFAMREVLGGTASDLEKELGYLPKVKTGA